MTDLIANAQRFYKWQDEVADPRVKTWFLLTSPWPVLLTSLVYLLVVWFGPRLMKDREAFSLKPLIIVYNLGSVVLATYIFYELIATAVLFDHNWVCQPVDYSTEPLPMRMTNVFYFHLLARAFECLETVFFIMRKKNNQITFLHVYHHCTMLINAYLVVRYIAGGNSNLYTAMNAFVHIFMYTYYGLAAMGPQMQKYLSWKRHLTTLQLVQFLAFYLHTLYVLIAHRDCPYPIAYTLHMHTYAIILAILFGNFYYQSYVASAKKKQKQKEQ